MGEGVGQREQKGLQNLHLTEMAYWREGDKTRNAHLGSARKMDAEASRQKARRMTAEALGMWACSYDLFHQPSEVAPKSKPNRKGETPICPSSQPWLSATSSPSQIVYPPDPSQYSPQSMIMPDASRALIVSFIDCKSSIHSAGLFGIIWELTFHFIKNLGICIHHERFLNYRYNLVKRFNLFDII
jgi:hypothetical protein